MRRFDKTQHPSLYEINTRVWLFELSQSIGRTITLGNVPDAAIEKIASLGFDLVWLMGVFSTGELGRTIALEIPALQKEYKEALPDWKPKDVIGSPYAVKRYKVSKQIGGKKELASFRKKLAQYGIGLILDFVPNHTARDNPWIVEYPEFYIQGTQEDLQNDPGSFFLANTQKGERVIAFGKDPYFPAWTDTAQLNYQNINTRLAMSETLAKIAEQCDGVRCDMSMLLLEEIFQKTWGERPDLAGVQHAEGEFWAQAIDTVRQKFPKFLFLAEAYWDLEWRLLSLGFDYTYDKRLLDRLLEDDALPLRQHLSGDIEYQERQIRFLENHDEKRANAVFSPEKHHAAMVISATAPGMRFFHEGQREGYTKQLPVQLGRRTSEPVDQEIFRLYQQVLHTIQHKVFRIGKPRFLFSKPAADNDSSYTQFLLWRWEAGEEGQALVVVNFGPNQAQCRVPLSFSGIEGRSICLIDQLSKERFDRDGNELVSSGLYLKMPPWQAAIYYLTKNQKG